MNKLLIYIFLSGLIFTFLIPPFQKPDETVHFQKTLAVSQGIFSCPKNDIIQVDKQFSDLVNNKVFHEMIANKNKKIGFLSYLNQIRSSKVNRQPVSMNIYMSCRFPPISYFPQAFGLLISRILNLNSLLSFLIGRFTGFFILFYWFIYLYRRLPNVLKTIILFCFGLPMTIHQLSAYSYDGVQIMFALTIFILLTTVIKTKSFSKQHRLYLLISVLGFIFSRPITQIPYDLYSQRPANLTLISNLLFFISMIIKTTLVRFNFYLVGLIGIFGWLEYRLDWWVYFFIGMVFIYLVVNLNLPKKLLLSRFMSIIIFLSLVFAYIFILTVLYIFNTPFGRELSEGTQGRYFLPFFPFLLYWLVDIRNKHLPQFNKIKIRLPDWLLQIILIIIIISIIKSIVGRFYLI